MQIYCLLTSTPIEELRRHPPAEVDMVDHLEEFGKKLGEVIAALWSQAWVQNTYKLRGGRFSMPDNMSYFFPRAEEIMDITFKPSADDIIRTRVRTTGVIMYTYEFDETVFRIIGMYQSVYPSHVFVCVCV